MFVSVIRPGIIETVFVYFPDLPDDRVVDSSLAGVEDLSSGRLPLRRPVVLPNESTDDDGSVVDSSLALIVVVSSLDPDLSNDGRTVDVMSDPCSFSERACVVVSFSDSLSGLIALASNLVLVSMNDGSKPLKPCLFVDEYSTVDVIGDDDGKNPFDERGSCSPCFSVDVYSTVDVIGDDEWKNPSDERGSCSLCFSVDVYSTVDVIGDDDGKNPFDARGSCSPCFSVDVYSTVDVIGDDDWKNPSNERGSCSICFSVDVIGDDEWKNPSDVLDGRNSYLPIGVVVSS